MAKYFAGYLSPIKNKLGNAVGRKWRNLNVLAVYQPNVKNPRTTPQMAQRRKLSIISNLAQGMSHVIKRGFDTSCKGTKVFPRAKFISKNMGAVSSVDSTINWANIVVSQGNLVQPSFATATATRPETVDVNFGYDSLLIQYRDIDEEKVKVYAAVYCPTVNATVMSSGVVYDQETVSVRTPSEWNGMEVQVWGFAIYEGAASDVDGLRSNEACTSTYVGHVTLV